PGRLRARRSTGHGAVRGSPPPAPARTGRSRVRPPQPVEQVRRPGCAGPVVSVPRREVAGDIPLRLRHRLEHPVGQREEPRASLGSGDELELGGVGGERLELGGIRGVVQFHSVGEPRVRDRGELVLGGVAQVRRGCGVPGGQGRSRGDRPRHPPGPVVGALERLVGHLVGPDVVRVAVPPVRVVRDHEVGPPPVDDGHHLPERRVTGVHERAQVVGGRRPGHSRVPPPPCPAQVLRPHDPQGTQGPGELGQPVPTELIRPVRRQLSPAVPEDLALLAESAGEHHDFRACSHQSGERLSGGDCRVIGVRVDEQRPDAGAVGCRSGLGHSVLLQVGALSKTSATVSSALPGPTTVPVSSESVDNRYDGRTSGTLSARSATSPPASAREAREPSPSSSARSIAPSSSASQTPYTPLVRAGAAVPIVRGGVDVVADDVVVSGVRGVVVVPVSGSGGVRLGTVVGGRRAVGAPAPGAVSSAAHANLDAAATPGSPSTRCQPTTASTRPCGSASAYRATASSSHTRAPTPAARSWSATVYAAVAARGSSSWTPSVTLNGVPSRSQRPSTRWYPAAASSRSTAGWSTGPPGGSAGNGTPVPEGADSPVTIRPTTSGPTAADTARRMAASDIVGATVLKPSSSCSAPPTSRLATPGTVSATSEALGGAETSEAEPGPLRSGAPGCPAPVGRRTTSGSSSGASAQYRSLRTSSSSPRPTSAVRTMNGPALMTGSRAIAPRNPSGASLRICPGNRWENSVCQRSGSASNSTSTTFPPAPARTFSIRS